MTPFHRPEPRNPELVRALGFLVVEDHEFQRSMLVRMLQHMNARHVYSAADGRAGLELLSNHGDAIDVVISDLDMPGMDGMEFIRHVGVAGRGVSLIVASALERGLLASVETMATAHGIRFLGSIEKPGTPGKLEQLIQHPERGAEFGRQLRRDHRQIAEALAIQPAHGFPGGVEGLAAKGRETGEQQGHGIPHISR